MFKSKDNMKMSFLETVNAFSGLRPDQGPIKVSFNTLKIFGNGSFGIVFQARLVPSGEMVAIKKVKQEKKYKNRELDIMCKLNHTNIVKLRYYYYSIEGKDKQKWLNLILEYFPNNLFDVIKQYSRNKQSVPLPYIKVYAYQLFRSLAYLHSLGISHRDIKPANLLINTETGVLKLCDFGSAKYLVKGETSVSYICSRFYRAPELLFSCTDYSFSIDVWSAGCIFAELMLNRPIFLGDDHVSQLVEIMKVLGTPSKDEIKHMNKSYAEYDYPYLSPQPWQEIFKGKASSEAIDLISHLLVYTPSNRITPLQACAHKYFNELRKPGAKLVNSKELPPLFNFSEHELKIQPNLNHILIPQHLKDYFRPTSDDSATVISEASSSTHTLTPSSIQAKMSVCL